MDSRKRNTAIRGHVIEFRMFSSKIQMRYGGACFWLTHTLHLTSQVSKAFDISILDISKSLDDASMSFLLVFFPFSSVQYSHLLSLLFYTPRLAPNLVVRVKKGLCHWDVTLSSLSPIRKNNTSNTKEFHPHPQHLPHRHLPFPFPFPQPQIKPN